MSKAPRRKVRHMVDRQLHDEEGFSESFREMGRTYKAALLQPQAAALKEGNSGKKNIISGKGSLILLSL